MGWFFTIVLLIVAITQWTESNTLKREIGDRDKIIDSQNDKIIQILREQNCTLEENILLKANIEKGKDYHSLYLKMQDSVSSLSIDNPRLNNELTMARQNVDFIAMDREQVIEKTAKLNKNTNISRCDYCNSNDIPTRLSPYIADMGCRICEPCWHSAKKEFSEIMNWNIGKFYSDNKE